MPLKSALTSTALAAAALVAVGLAAAVPASAVTALTIEHTVLANTGSELPVFALVLAGTVAVLAGGVTVAVARRRSEAGAA